MVVVKISCGTYKPHKTNGETVETHKAKAFCTTLTANTLL